MIKAICFDLDGVYFTEEGKQGFHKDLVELIGDESAVEEFLYKSTAMRNLSNGSLGKEAFRAMSKEILGIDISLEEFSQMRVKHYSINSNVKHTIDKLRDQAYKICTCTNNNPIRIDALEERFGFKKDFDALISSHEVGAFKPDKRIFTELIDILNIEAHEIVYTDDREDRLSGAKELGIHTYLFDNLEGYKKYISSLGVSTT